MYIYVLIYIFTILKKKFCFFLLTMNGNFTLMQIKFLYKCLFIPSNTFRPVCANKTVYTLDFCWCYLHFCLIDNFYFYELFVTNI